MLMLLMPGLCALGLGVALVTAEPDTAVARRAVILKEAADGCLTSPDTLAMEQMFDEGIFISEYVDGTSYFVAYRSATAAEIAIASFQPVSPDTARLVVGSHVQVSAAVLDTGSSPSPPIISKWDLVLGSGELPMAIEWMLLTTGWCGALTIQTPAPLLRGLPTGVAHPGWGGFTVTLAVQPLNETPESGPQGVYDTVREALEVLDREPATAARLLDSGFTGWEPPNALRALHAKALGRSGRCADQLVLTMKFAAEGLTDSAIAACSEGYCYSWNGNYEAMATWAYEHAGDPAGNHDCVGDRWKFAIEGILRNPRDVGDERTRAFMEKQAVRFVEMPEANRFAECRGLVRKWLVEN